MVRNLYRELESGGLAAPAILVPDWQCRMLRRQTVDEREIFTLKMPSPPLLDKAFLKRGASFLTAAPLVLPQLYRLLKKRRIAVVNPHYPGPYLFHFTLLKTLFPVLFRFVVSCHGSDVLAIEDGAPGAAISRLVLRSADAVTVPSRALAAKLGAAVPELAGKIECIYNGIGQDKFISRINEETAPSGEYIIHVGSFELIKGQDILLQAFKEVLQVRSDVKLLLVGRSGTFLSQLEQLCVHLGIVEAVRILTDVPPDAIPQLLAQARFLALPSRYEGGMPLVILEAGAVRRTVVATRVGGIGEVITHRRNGLLVPPEDPAALAKAMLTLLDDRQLRQSLAENLHQAILPFSWSRTVRRYRAVARGLPENS